MPVTNTAIGAIFDEIADWLELDQANPFRIRAYRNAARVIGTLPQPIGEMAQDAKALDALPGIGKDLAEKIGEIVRTGTCDLLQKLRHTHPRGLRELLRIPGIGPKKAVRLYKAGGIRSARQLADAARAGHIHAIEGFGARSESALLQAASTYLSTERRWKLIDASQQADALVQYLVASGETKAVAVAGSYRRQRETVGDLDVLATGDRHAAIIQAFLAYPDIGRVLSKGTTRSSVLLKIGMQVDLRVVKAESFGSAMVYFTGSKSHNVALRRLAQKRGLKINEYGVYRGDQRIAGTTEASVYATLDLPFIPPELQENRGELEAAAEQRLPDLIDIDDLRGDLHVHTTATDGRASLEEMARAAKQAGLSYIAITDHSKHVAVVHGLDADDIARQIDEIDRFNDRQHDFVLLKGVEVDILEDGSLDLPPSILRRLDLVVGAVHSQFRLSRTRQTERILRAMDQPCFSVLAHPTGRLIEERAPYDVDVERLISHAKDRGCFLEINAQPDRLDLNDTACRLAKDAGVRLAISSDAHDVHGFNHLRFGVGQARRGWLERGDVINTLPLRQLRTVLKATMA